MDVMLASVTHDFGKSRALDSVNFSATAGSLSALVGENGAGKTTLMRVLYGALRPTSGEVSLDGTVKHFRKPADAIAAGVGMVSQHYSVISEINCLDNLILGAEPGWWVDRKSARQRASELAEKMGFEFDWEATADTLSPSGKQKLEILKLLWRGAKVMILDEPTAMLSPVDSDALYSSLRSLADDGATIIVVTHRIPEVLDHCEKVSVLRGGRLVVEKPVKGTSPSELAELIVGKALSKHAVTVPSDFGPGLVLDRLSVTGSRGETALDEVTIDVNLGSLVGLAGVDGNGQRELFRAIFGTLRPRSGRVSLRGTDLTTKKTSERIKHGLRSIPEDRHEEGVIEDWSLVDNAALGLQRTSEFTKGVLIDRHALAKAAAAMADKFNTKHGGLHQAMKSLSGGNQQRFVAARSLHGAPTLLLAFQPTRGLDIEATNQVYAGLRDACRNGACALVVSFDLDELLEFCDRVLVIDKGKVKAPRPGCEKDRAEIAALMVGAA
ncbi:MAG: ATP-binding cassette domain-containing protein [Chthonomonadaceae bacterium]|nr:ATP-binding cassette domain-containing protein [Chthonomonadaceae bacterium]